MTGPTFLDLDKVRTRTNNLYQDLDKLSQRVDGLEEGLKSLDSDTKRMAKVVLGDSDLNIDSVPKQLEKMNKNIQRISWALIGIGLILGVLMWQSF